MSALDESLKWMRGEPGSFPDIDPIELAYEAAAELAQLREDNKYLNSEIDRLDNLIEPLLHSDEEFAQLRVALAERDKTVAEARAVITGIVAFGYEVTEYTMGNARKWLSAHPAQESEEL